MRKIYALFFLNLLFLSPAFCFTRSNFDTPESFVADSETGAYYVSNIGGGPLAKDGNGYISKISSNGNLVIQKFIGGKSSDPVLNAPKGLLVLGKEIWVTDIDTVKVFNKKSGKPIRTIDASSHAPKFLNDLAWDGEHSVYVSDMLGDQILKIDTASNDKMTVFKNGSQLGNPNGLVFNPKSKSLMVVGFRSGEILEIDRRGRAHTLKKGLSGLDGIDYDSEGNVFVSSFDKGEIYKIPLYGRGSLTVFLSGLTTPSDISCDRKRSDLLIPSYKANTVTTVFLFDKSLHS